MNDQQQKIIDSVLGRRVLIKKGHPHAGETGTVEKFYETVGITGKPGFEVKGDNGESFFIFSANEIKYI